MPADKLVRRPGNDSQRNYAAWLQDIIRLEMKPQYAHGWKT